MTDNKFIMPEDFVPENYFLNCYSIDHQDEPQRVLLKTSVHQANFIRALPLHHTQQEEESTDDYSIFSYYLCPHTYDFKQAILAIMTEAEVLEPRSLRAEIAEIIQTMSRKYTTV